MTTKKSVGVIGAGVFGVYTAIQLAESGYDVTIYDKSENFFLGATSNTQNRLHLGLHYPRDLETAVQSRIGFKKFLEKFPESVRLDFPNYYAVAKQGSKVTSLEFQEFAMAAGVELTQVSPRECQMPEFDYSKVDSVWRCDEGVIDVDVLRSTLLQKISELQIQVFLGVEIERVENAFSGLKVLYSKEREFTHSHIVRATYGLDSISSSSVNLGNREFEFHKTLILEDNLEAEPFGFTVIDGDFLTILPKGFSDRFLMYGPSICVLERYIGKQVPSDWAMRDFSDELSLAEQALTQRVSEWLPSLIIKRTSNWNTTVRTILPYMSATDKRTSQVLAREQGFIDIWSGKMDHCIEIAEQVCQLIETN